MSLVDARAIEVNGIGVPFAEGLSRIGDLEVEIVGRDLEDGRALDVVVRNPGRSAIALEDVVIRVDATPAQVLEHGHQSWSVVRRCAPDDVRPERARPPRLGARAPT